MSDSTHTVSPLTTESLWREMASLMGLGMETLVFTVWYDALSGSPAAWTLQVGMLGGILFISRSLTRRGYALQGKKGLRELLLLGWMGISLIVSLRLLLFAGQAGSLYELGRRAFAGSSAQPTALQLYLHILIAMLIVGRGVLLGNQSTHRGNVLHSFQWGLVSFLIYGLFFGQLQTQKSLILLFAFLAAGLLAMSFARIADLGLTRGGRLPRFSPSRVLHIFLSTGVVIFTALLAAYALNGKAASIIAELFLALVAAVMAGIIFLLSPALAFLLELFFRIGERIFANVPDVFQESAMEAAAEQALENSEESVRLLSNLVSKSLPLILGAIVLAVVVWAIVQFRKAREQSGLALEEEQTEGLRVSRPKLRLPFGTQAQRRIGPLQPARMIAAARIRRTYARLMDLSARLGAPRPAAMTPLEFLPRIKEVLPQNGEDLNQITAAYVRVRYGEIPESAEEVEEVLAAWERIRGAGKAALRKLRKG